jgi:hypothetical protein
MLSKNLSLCLNSSPRAHHESTWKSGVPLFFRDYWFEKQEQNELTINGVSGEIVDDKDNDVAAMFVVVMEEEEEVVVVVVVVVVVAAAAAVAWNSIYIQ